MKSRNVLGLLAAGLFLLGSFGAILSAQEPAKQEQCVVVVHTPNLQGTVTKVSNLVSQASPMFGQMVPMFLPKVIGAPSFNGINLMGGFSLVVLNPEKYRPSPAVRIVAISDPQGALQNFAAAGRSEGEQDGVHVIAQMDRARFMAATPEEKQNIEQFMKKRFYVGVAGNYAAVADSREACAAVVGMLKSGTLKPDAVCTLKGDILLNVNIQELMNIYGEQIDQKLAPIKGMMQMGMQQAPGQVNPQAAAGIINAYVDALVDFVKQLKALELAVAMGDDGVRLRGCLDAKPESDDANILKKQKKGGTEMLRFIPSDSFLAAAANVQLTEEIQDGIGELTEKILNASQVAVPPEQREKLIQSTKEGMELFGDQFGIGVAVGGEEQQGGISIVEVFSVKDPATAYSRLVKQFDQSAMFLGYYKNVMGLQIELALTEKAATHQDVSITEVAILFDPATFPAEARQALQKLYGDPMIVRFAVVGKYAIVTFGQDSLARMKQTIEYVKADGGSDLQAQPEFISATKGFPKETNLLLFLNPRELAKFVKAMAPPMGAPGGEQPELALKGGIGAYVVANGSRVEGELYVPQEFIESLKAVFMPQMGPAPAPGAPPAPPMPR